MRKNPVDDAAKGRNTRPRGSRASARPLECARVNALGSERVHKQTRTPHIHPTCAPTIMHSPFYAAHAATAAVVAVASLRNTSL